MEHLEAIIKKNVLQLTKDAIERFSVNSTIAIDSTLNNMFEQKGFKLSYILDKSMILIPGHAIKLRAIVLTVDEYAKLCNNQPLIVRYTSCSVVNIVHSIPVIAYVLIGKDYIAEFDKLIKSMNPYTNKDVKRLTRELAIANETISQLRLELKTFRSAKKNERKKLAKPPPEYIDDRPPDF